MKTIQLFLIGVMIALYACNNDKGRESQINLFNFKIPIVIDTICTDQMKHESVWLEYGNYNPLYIGPRKDSIYLTYKPNFKRYYVYYDKIKSYKNPDSLEILLQIDTSKIISNYEYSISWNDDGSRNSKSFKAFSVFVVNTTKDTLSIGDGDQLPIVREALDKQGKWRPIESPFIYMCGTGLNAIILPPNEIVVTSTPINEGNFKTKLRLRYNKIMSSEFSGTINISQFESEWDSNGKGKSLPKQ